VIREEMRYLRVFMRVSVLNAEVLKLVLGLVALNVFLVFIEKTAPSGGEFVLKPQYVTLAIIAMFIVAFTAKYLFMMRPMIRENKRKEDAMKRSGILLGIFNRRE
jgi:fumarate reductase subunit C